MTFQTTNEVECWNHTIPFEYESIEKAEYDFLIDCEVHHPHSQNFEFAGETYNPFDFMKRDVSFDKKHNPIYSKLVYYNGPKFYTLEDWFEKNKTN
jgi:hypothetical protein